MTAHLSTNHFVNNIQIVRYGLRRMQEVQSSRRNVMTKYYVPIVCILYAYCMQQYVAYFVRAAAVHTKSEK